MTPTLSCAAPGSARTCPKEAQHFVKLIAADALVMRRTLDNPRVRSVVMRKNQGRESGASPPHIRQQTIGSPQELPAVAAEARAERQDPTSGMNCSSSSTALDLSLRTGTA